MGLTDVEADQLCDISYNLRVIANHRSWEIARIREEVRKERMRLEAIEGMLK